MPIVLASPNTWVPDLLMFCSGKQPTSVSIWA